MCHCWNNLGMKGHVPSLVKMVITSLQPRLPRTNRKTGLCLCEEGKCLSSDTCCQDLARMTHQFPIHMLWHQSNLHSLSPVISYRFEGCNLKHERFFCFVFRGCIMQNIKCAKNICDSHSFPVYTIFFFSPPSTWYNAIIFKVAKFKTFEGDRCFNYARAGKHLIWGSQMHLIWSTQQLNPLAECTVLSESVTPMGKDFYITLWLHLSFKMLNLLTVS